MRQSPALVVEAARPLPRSRHGHKPYVVLGTYQEVCGVQAEQGGQARPETERGGGA